MQLAGTIMAGAQVRLLPPSIPYRFFVASGIYHVVAWALVLMAADQIPVYQGGAGTVLAALHALTLGVFAMTAMGASFQILPVVTNQSLTALWPIRMASWLFIPGVGVLIAGFAGLHDGATATGGVLVAAGFALYAYVIVGLLRGASGFRVLTVHIRLALLALAALVVLGVGMIFDWLPMDPSTTAAVHGTVAIFGFMGLFAMGFGSILVPMFALASAASDGRSLAVMALYGAGLVLGVFGALAEFYQTAVFGAGLLLLGAVAHILIMTGLLKKGMKKKLGLSFVLIRVSWVLFPVSIAVGIAAVSGLPFDPALLMAGYLAVFGWLLTFVLGVQQQVMPFLAAMNTSKAGGKSPRLSELAKGRPLKIHAVCHFLAIALVGIGIVVDLEVAVQAGASFGLIGAVAFIQFTINVYRRMLASVQNQESSPP